MQMKVIVAAVLAASAAAVVPLARVQQPATSRLPATEPARALYPLDTAFLEWPLPAGGQAYADIEGKRLHTYVVDQAASRETTAIRGTRSSGVASLAHPGTQNQLTGWPGTSSESA